ncbi:MAG: glycine cleavage system protein GcvH [Gammaproteobacteria bacterium]|nr:glycine cleavage system protein GcvH [Gammaproteobacteria bacterium]
MKSLPPHLKYTRTHEWVKSESDNSVTIGITEHAQSLLGDMVFVELPEYNREFKQATEMAVLESVKAAADVYAPISGRILEVNTKLQNQPELINKDPYGEGWICKLKLIDQNELTQLLSAAEYEKEI